MRKGVYKGAWSDAPLIIYLFYPCKRKACSVEPDFATCGSYVSLLLSFHTEKKVSNYFLQRKRIEPNILSSLYLLSTVPSLPRKFAHGYAVKFATVIR